MTSHEFRKPLSPQESLAAAKAAFRVSVLQNDTLFDILRTRLSKSESTGTGLPDFGLEPTLRRNDDGTSTVGLCISHSATSNNGDISTHLDICDYLPLGVMNRTTGDTKVTPELEAALTSVGKEKTDALDILQAWQAGVAEMSTHVPGSLMLDPTSDTFELQEELMARNYVVRPE